MQMFAPNVMVVGDTIFDLQDATGRPNPPAAAARYEAEVMAMRGKIKAQPFGARWLDITGNNAEPIVIVPTTATNDAVAQTFANIPEKPNRQADALARGFSPDATGRGTPVRVKFSTTALAGGLTGASGEVLLIHELTHAYRSASGRFSPLPMVGLVGPGRAASDVRSSATPLNDDPSGNWPVASMGLYDSSTMRHRPMGSKFSSAKPVGSIML